MLLKALFSWLPYWEYSMETHWGFGGGEPRDSLLLQDSLFDIYEQIR